MNAVLAPFPSTGVDPGPKWTDEGPFPGGRRFAFTILDDTDDATVENVRPVYNLLHELGMRTTKTVWPLDCPEGSDLYFAGKTLEDADYLAFVRELVGRGFELAFHGATMETSDRGRTLRGLEFIDDVIGAPLSIHCNHGQNGENLYWGAHRYRAALLRLPLLAAERIARRPLFDGHDVRSPRFWGDVCRARFKFVRGFTFPELNCGAIPPHGPYRLPSTPWVNHWFTTADAPDAAAFRHLVTPSAIRQLADRHGVCILSTHLGKRFARNGIVDPAVEDALRHIASLDGWFVPASTILEHQLATRGTDRISRITRWRLEMRHLTAQIRSRLLSHT